MKDKDGLRSLAEITIARGIGASAARLLIQPITITAIRFAVKDGNIPAIA